MWYHRADSLLNVFKKYPDAKEEKIDKMQGLLLQLKIKIAGDNKDKEGAAKAFEEYQETAYSKTPDGRWKMISYLMKNKRFDEAADIYMQLDSRLSQKNGGLSLDNIRKHYVGKFKANVQAGRKDTAWVVAEKVMMALDSAVNAYQQSEMAELTRLFRALAKQRMMPEEIATRLNDELTENNKSGMFVTMFIALVNLTTGHLDFCNAGHNPPVLGGDAEGGSFMKILSNAPIGLWAGLKFVGEEIDTIKGCPMFLYTDGLNEAENPQRQQFGEERMLKILRSIRFESAHKVISTLSSEVEQHRNGAEPNDDLTMFCFKIR